MGSLTAGFIGLGRGLRRDIGAGDFVELDATATGPVKGVSLVFFLDRGPPGTFVVDSFTDADLFLWVALFPGVNLAEARPFHFSEVISSADPPESEPENWSANAATAFFAELRRGCDTTLISSEVSIYYKFRFFSALVVIKKGS